MISPLYIEELTDTTVANFLVASVITDGLVWGASALSFSYVEKPGNRVWKALGSAVLQSTCRRGCAEMKRKKETGG